MKEEKGGDERGDEWRGRKSIIGNSRDVKGKMCSRGNVIDSKRRNRVKRGSGRRRETKESKKGRKRTSRKEWSGSRSRDSAGYGKDS